ASGPGQAARGGAGGALPAGLTLEVADPSIWFEPDSAFSSDHLRCSPDFFRPAGSGVADERGGDACAILRCVAP
ncbi:MAG: hypothetical protein EA398_17800, partial [Deltaproteobacteria bacterium]